MWTPYQNLFYVAYAQVASRFKGRSAGFVYPNAAAVAKRFAHNGTRQQDVALDTRLAGVEGIWPVAPGRPLPEGTQAMARRVAQVRMSDPLRHFALTHGTTNRTALERLILAWSAQGFTPDEVVRQAHKDYDSIKHVPKLSEHDVATYAFLFWDFAGQFDRERAAEWLIQHGREADADIYLGRKSLGDVRTGFAVHRAVDYNARLTNLAQKSMQVLESQLTYMLELAPKDNVLGIELTSRHGGTYYNSEHIKAVGGFMASSAPIMKGYKEMAVGDSGDESLADLVVLTHATLVSERKQHTEYHMDISDMMGSHLTEEMIQKINASTEEAYLAHLAEYGEPDAGDDEPDEPGNEP